MVPLFSENLVLANGLADPVDAGCNGAFPVILANGFVSDLVNPPDVPFIGMPATPVPVG